MKKITIGFSKPSTWKIGAELEMWWCKSPYSHAYIRYCDDQGRDLIFQASHGSVHPQLYVNFLSDNIVTEEICLDFTDQEYQKMRDFYYDKMGELYAYKDLIFIFVYEFLAKVGIKISNEKIPGYICSQLVAQMLSEVKGIKFDKPFNLIKPNDLFNSLK